MATASSLISEITEILQEDHSKAEVWTTTDLLNLLKLHSRTLGAETLCRDINTTGVTFKASGTSYAVPTNYIAGYHIRWLGTTQIEFQDFRYVGFMSGLTNPWAAGTPQTVSEMHRDDGTKILRLFPKYNTSGATATMYYKAEFNYPAATTSGVSLSDWFVLPLKFRTLGNAYSVLSDVQNPQKAKIFYGLGDIVARALKSLFQGGQFI